MPNGIYADRRDSSEPDLPVQIWLSSFAAYGSRTLIAPLLNPDVNDQFFQYLTVFL